MSRRIVRSTLQLGLVAFSIFFLLYLIDTRYAVLPSSLHSHLPQHNHGFVVTDLTVNICSFGSCQLPPSKWHRINKDLYLKKGWLSKAYVHIQLKKEENLKEDDRVVVDIKIGRLDPSKSSEKLTPNEVWESRPGGIWLKRSNARHASDQKTAVTSVDVLFGADAVDPRPGWELKESAILLDYSKDSIEARLTVRTGQPLPHDMPTVRVRKDGKFKILQASDLHVSTGVGECREPFPVTWKGGKCEADPRTLEFMGKLLDDEKPDLVILSGDQVNGETAPDSQSAILKIADLLISRKIPYAAIMGNHDDEGSLTREQSIDFWSSLPYSLTTTGPEALPGYGNYYVQVMSYTGHHSALTIWLLDSHSYSPDENKYKGYNWIKPEQISWFKDVANGLKVSNAKYSHIHLDMAFVHIPLPEYRGAGLMIGQREESITAPNYNSHFYDALIEMNIPVISVGHDHVNEFCLFPDRFSLLMPPDHPDAKNKPKTQTQNPNKLERIWLCQGGGAGFGGYGGYGDYVRRMRLFELDANTGRMLTWKRLEYGDVAQKLDEQMVVDNGRAVVPKIKDAEDDKKEKSKEVEQKKD